MIIHPLSDRVLVRRLENDQKTKFGIFLPDDAKQKSTIGIVEEVGPGKLNKEGQVIPLQVKKGQKVMFSKYAGNEVASYENDLLIMKEEEILAILEDQ